MKNRVRRVYANLRAWMEATGRNQAEAAAELGISVPFFNQLLSGARQPALDRALDIAQKANVPVESLRKTTQNAN